MSELIAAVIGGTVVAVTGAAAFLYKRRIDALSTRQLSLYRLLELYRSVRLSDTPGIEQQVDWYLEVVQELFPDENISEKKTEARAALIPMIADASKSVAQEDDGSLLVSYKETVSNLAPVSPLLAYRLSANTSLKAALGEIDRYHKNVKSLLSDGVSEKDIELMTSAMAVVKARATDSVVSELRRDILWLAFRCGIVPLAVLIYRFYVRKDISMEKTLKEEYRAVLLALKAKIGET